MARKRYKCQAIPQVCFTLISRHAIFDWGCNRLSNFHAQEIGEDRFFDAGFAVSYLDQEREDDGYLLELASTYYPTKKLGVGLRGAYAHVGEKDEFTYGATSEYFVNENLAFNASYTRLDSKADGFSIASNVFQFGTKVRF